MARSQVVASKEETILARDLSMGLDWAKFIITSSSEDLKTMKRCKFEDDRLGTVVVTDKVLSGHTGKYELDHKLP